MLRIGQGYDVHRLAAGRKLIVGGVEIEYERGLLGHSDADVLLHAIADSLLGAAALGDIGCLFPDNDPQYEGADSLILLKKVAEHLKNNGFSIVNIDSTIIAQAPKMKPWIPQMRANIALVCDINVSSVSVKATTEEKMGFTGEGLGIAAQAIALVKKNN